MTLAATIVIPTHDHGDTLRLTVASALTQTVSDIEVFIIGDGVPDATKPIVQAIADSDERVTFVDYPKHARRGEPYRHEALQHAQGDIVCYLCDRDLWLPNHLELLRDLLRDADFAHTLSGHIMPGGELKMFPTNLSLRPFRELQLSGTNRVALSCAGHTMSLYRRLPHGWRETPQGIYTDLYMFEQILRLPECRAASGTWPTALTFPSPPRKGWSSEQRVAEMQQWADRIATAEGRSAVCTQLLEATATSAATEMAELFDRSRQLDDVHHSLLWKLRRLFGRS